jgi:hypothetical protein
MYYRKIIRNRLNLNPTPLHPISNMSRYVLRPGYYPLKQENEEMNRTKIRMGQKSFLVVTYETGRKINIFVGGHEKWCINCELIKRDNEIQQTGYLIKVRYDKLCSLEYNFQRGFDTKQLLIFLVKYINDKYPAVKGLLFNDMSTRSCDNEYEMNLAVMTYLYSEKTWYEKNFGAYISPQSKEEWKKIITKYNASKKESWDNIKETIRNEEEITNKTDEEMEELYRNTINWKEFFEPIYNEIGIGDFCNFVSLWIDSFIGKYFNNLQSLTFILPIRSYMIEYKEEEYKGSGGRRFTRRNTNKMSRDYK